MTFEPKPEPERVNHLGRVALVTGASSGIGQAIALRLAHDGARVANIDIASGEQTEDLARRERTQVRSFACDLSDPAAIRDSLAAVSAALGAPTIAVHAAAVLFLKPFEQISADEWRRTQAVNQEAAFHLGQGVLPGMRAAQWGRIVLIASSAFWTGGPTMTHYITSKGGLMGLAHGLAAEVGELGVTVNCVAPGLTRTTRVQNSLSDAFFGQVASLQSIRRNGTPADQAGVVSFLASDDAAFITGQTLIVDGGQALS